MQMLLGRLATRQDGYPGKSLGQARRIRAWQRQLEFDFLRVLVKNSWLHGFHPLFEFL
jgi:hypothetical protein